jgi:DNA-directed RNA polymerase specialized sigma subunit
MGKMDIEKMLREYPHYAQDIQKLNKELNDTLEMKLSTQNTLKAQVLTGMPHDTRISDLTYEAVEQSIDRHEEHIKKLCEQIQEYYSNKEYIDNAIKSLTMEEYRVIDLYYFKGYHLRKVAGIMHYGKSQCWNLRESALKKMQDENHKRVDKSGQMPCYNGNDEN